MVRLWSRQYKSYARVSWGKSYRRDKNERNITTSCSEGNVSSHLWQLLLIHPLGNSCAVCLKEREKGPEDKSELYLHSHYECRSMTNLNTDLKGFNPETTASATMVPSGQPLGKLDTFLSQHIPAAVVLTNKLYSKILKWERNSKLRRTCCFLSLVYLCVIVQTQTVKESTESDDGFISSQKTAILNKLLKENQNT